MPYNLDQIAAATPEDIEIAGMRIALQALLNRQRQTLHAAAHVGVAGGDPDPDAARDRDHRRLRSSSTRCSASASTSRSTRTRQPPLSSISIIPTLARCAGGDDGGCGMHVEARAGVKAISTGTSAGTASPLSRSSRANRRHVNNWLADNPLRRAVTDTNRGPPYGSATIRCFSSNVQRRRAPVETTSSRETFELGVWSVIRLCLHPPSRRARRPSPDRYDCCSYELNKRTNLLRNQTNRVHRISNQCRVRSLGFTALNSRSTSRR